MADKKPGGTKPTTAREGDKQIKPPARPQRPDEGRGYEHIQTPVPAPEPDRPFTGGYEPITAPKPPPKKQSGKSGGGKKP